MSNESVRRLSKLWRFWMAVRWYLVIVLIFLGLLVFYKKEEVGLTNIVVFVVFFILFLLVVMFFNDNTGGSFATSPLPPHLGLDGVSREVSAAY